MKINAAFVYFRGRKKNAESVDFAPRLQVIGLLDGMEKSLSCVNLSKALRFFQS